MNTDLNYEIYGSSKTPPLQILHKIDGNIASWNWFHSLKVEESCCIISNLPGASNSSPLDQLFNDIVLTIR